MEEMSVKDICKTKRQVSCSREARGPETPCGMGTLPRLEDAGTASVQEDIHLDQIPEGILVREDLGAGSSTCSFKSRGMTGGEWGRTWMSQEKHMEFKSHGTLCVLLRSSNLVFKPR